MILTLGLAQRLDTQLFLDLTDPQISQMEEAKTVGCGGFGSVHTTGRQPYSPPHLTLRLQIESVNESRFKLGDELLLDLQLTNIGDKTVVLPWDPDSDIVYGKNCKDFGKALPSHTLLGSLALKVVDTEGKAYLVAAHEIFGLSDHPATYRFLAPGQSAHLRMSGKLNLPQAAIRARSTGATNHFKVVAIFDLTDSSIPNPYQTVVSANASDLTVIGSDGSAF